ncbi:MAG: hypothetical protein JWQ87_1063 [Candidatus Sulfotelmatobacter sp.]|nr:hypothetical protein [Candidatus Sulfotelmatobacter sp.]
MRRDFIFARNLFWTQRQQMTVKKQSPKQEPFLNTVARKLGYAAGALTNAAQGLTDNISALPKISSKARTKPASDADSSTPGRKPSKRRVARTSPAQRRRKSPLRKPKKAAKKSRRR